MELIDQPRGNLERR